MCSSDLVNRSIDQSTLEFPARIRVQGDATTAVTLCIIKNVSQKWTPVGITTYLVQLLGSICTCTCMYCRVYTITSNMHFETTFQNHSISIQLRYSMYTSTTQYLDLIYSCTAFVQ